MFKKLFNSAALAKFAAWLGGLLAAGAAQHAFGKYNSLVGTVAPLLVGLGIHNASNTSNGKPAPVAPIAGARKLPVIVAAFLALSVCAHAQAPAKPKKKHALVKIASVAASPVTHPKRTLKATLGSVLFAVETGVDGARLGLEGADKVFDALSIQGKVPVLDQIYAVVSVGAKDAKKADLWLERQEQGLFGTHN